MDEWQAFHFSQANPADGRRDDVPALLHRVADTISGLGDVTVIDVVFHTEITADGPWHSVTVYYERPSTEP